MDAAIKLEVFGPCTYPVDRIDQKFHIVLHSDDPVHSAQEIKSLHHKGGDGNPLYRKVKGALHPVYDLPKGLGLLDKVRGENAWRGWVHIDSQTVTNALILLGQNRLSYLGTANGETVGLAINITVQNTDPASE